MSYSKNFLSAFEELMKLEHSSILDMLHKNKGETGYTYMGIYQVAHRHWKGWKIIKKLKYSPRRCYINVKLQDLVKSFYNRHFWGRAKLNRVKEYRVALEIFIFGVNVGMRTAIKKAQYYVGAKEDGYVGAETLGLLNKVDKNIFNMEFDKIEVKYYERLVKAKPKFAMFLKGWKNRAYKC